MALLNKLEPLVVAIIALVFCVLLFSGVSPAQKEAVPLAIEDALRVREFADWSPIALSPDGKSLAYTVRENWRANADELRNSHGGVPLWASGTDIYIEDIEKGKTRSLTCREGSNWLPVWSPDGHYLAFLSDRERRKEPRLWVWDSIKHKFRKVSDIAVRTDQIEWTPDSHELLVTAVSERASRGDGAKTRLHEEQAEKGAESDAPGATVLLYSSGATSSRGNDPIQSGPWDLDERTRDLALIDARSGRATILVHSERIARYLLSSDGASIAYTSPLRFESQGSQQILFSLRIVRIATGEEQRIGPQFRLDYDGAEFSWSPDGSQLAIQSGGIDETHFDCYAVAARDGSVRNVTMFVGQALSHRKASTPLWDKKGEIYVVHEAKLWRTSSKQGPAVEVGRVPNRKIVRMIPQADNLVWSPDEESAVVVTHDDREKQDGFFRIDLENGEARKLLEAGECYTCANLSEPFTGAMRSTELVYFAEDAAHHSDLWISRQNFNDPKRLTCLNPQLDKYQMGRPRLVNWLSSDGESLQGILLLPSGFRKDERFPLVVWVYGGASLSDDFDRFGLGYSGPFNPQLLATRGYAVLLPDTPLNVGTPMLDLAKTVLPAINRVIDMGIVDPDKLGVVGHSYGGYSTVALIVQTNRFNAAVEVDGYGDLMAHYGEMDKDGTAFGLSTDEHGQGLMGGSPWEFSDRYIQNSPIFYLRRMKTPLLIVHGSNDTTVAPFLGDELFVALRRLGKRVEYAKYEGEGHSPPYWSFPNQVDLCNRMLSWFNLYLRESAAH